MAPHSSILAWRMPWMEEPGRLQSMGLWRVRHDSATSLSLFTFMHWRMKWQPTPAFLPGESQGWRSMMGFCLWGCRVRHDWSDAAAAAAVEAHCNNSTERYFLLPKGGALPCFSHIVPSNMYHWQLFTSVHSDLAHHFFSAFFKKMQLIYFCLCWIFTAADLP